MVQAEPAAAFPADYSVYSSQKMDDKDLELRDAGASHWNEHWGDMMLPPVECILSIAYGL